MHKKRTLYIQMYKSKFIILTNMSISTQFEAGFAYKLIYSK